MHTVVVGAGSSGCVLAARLTEDPAHRVTLVEAGPDYPTPSSVPADLTDARRNSMRKHDWGLRHKPRPGRMLFPFPRGRVVGGSSAVNTCIAIRGARQDFDEWGELGLEEWSWEQCLPAFCAIERDLDHGHRPDHGDAGPLPLQRPARADWVPWQRAFHQAALDLGHPEIDDHNAVDSRGVGPHAFNRLDGRRISAAEAWLTRAVRARPNLRVQSHTTVHHVVFDGTRATGLSVEQGGAQFTMSADRVVLCAGAIHTPGLLLRSGIGPTLELSRLGVDSRVHLPAVGARLLDHPGFAIFLRPRRGTARLRDPIMQLAVRYASPGSEWADMQVQPGSNAAFSLPVVPMISIMGHIGKPVGTGTIRFRSTDPNGRPHIDSNLMVAREDRAKAVAGLQLAWRLAQHPEMRRLATPLFPRTRVLDDAKKLDAMVRRWTDSGYHPCGTVPMGVSPDTAATDGRGKVYGTEALYVADASLMPTVPTGNIHLPTLMMAHRLAAWLAT